MIYRNMIYICSMYSKELLKGTISAIILKLLSEQERMYGYEISLKVKELSDGKILLKDGSLYPALQKMTNDGQQTTQPTNTSDDLLPVQQQTEY